MVLSDEEECTVSAGTMSAYHPTQCFEPGKHISAHPNGDAIAPFGFQNIYVLTQGPELVIIDAGPAPSFAAPGPGNYTIHSLVFDPNTLDLGIVQPGVTTGVDVFGLLIEGGGSICGSLDVAGAAIEVLDCACDADAGRLFSASPVQCPTQGVATITAADYIAPTVPEGFETIFVLTKAWDLKILAVAETASFDIPQVGFYRIHRLVYDPATLDLGIVEFGQTTGFDVFGLTVDGGGDICASLDVQGAVNLVLPEWLCNWYFIHGVEGRNDEMAAALQLEQAVEDHDSYESFEKALLGELLDLRMYPNPAVDMVNVDMSLLDGENARIDLIDGLGRVVSTEYYATPGRSTVTIDVSALPSGIYTLRFTSDLRTTATSLRVE